MLFGSTMFSACPRIYGFPDRVFHASSHSTILDFACPSFPWPENRQHFRRRWRGCSQWKMRYIFDGRKHYSFDRVAGIDIVIVLHTVELPSKWCVWSCSPCRMQTPTTFACMCTGCNDIVVTRAFIYARIRKHWRSLSLSLSHIILYNNSMSGVSIADSRFQSRHCYPSRGTRLFTDNKLSTIIII
jgi:hypothetical protein